MIPADATEDRTELPTPRRVQEARKQGRVAVSRDLTAAIGFLAAAIAFTMLGPPLIAGLGAGLTRSLSSLHEMETGTAVASMTSTGWGAFAVAAPLIVVAMVAALAGSLVQVGFLFTGETLKLRPERMNPVEGIRRAFSLSTAVGVAGGLAKGAVLLGVLAASLWQERVTLASLSTRPLPEAIGVASGAASSLFGKSALALLALALVDWAYRRWQHRRDLRMSRREVQDELREFEGDPAIRDRRRAHRGRLEEARGLGQVAEASVVIVDAGDTAVAIRRDEDDSLVVVASASGSAGDRIREAAIAHGVPVLERADLAASLRKRGKAGAPVPAALRDDASQALEVAREMKDTGRGPEHRP